MQQKQTNKTSFCRRVIRGCVHFGHFSRLREQIQCVLRSLSASYFVCNAEDRVSLGMKQMRAANFKKDVKVTKGFSTSLN